MFNHNTMNMEEWWMCAINHLFVDSHDAEKRSLIVSSKWPENLNLQNAFFFFFFWTEIQVNFQVNIHITITHG